MSVRNGLGNSHGFTQSSLRTACAGTVSDLRGSDTERDFADKWGTSAGTVRNVQNHSNDLSLQNFLRLGERFGPSGVNAVMNLIGLVAHPVEDVEIDVAKAPHDLAQVLTLIIELWSDGENCSLDMAKLEQSGAIDRLLTIADFVRNERSRLRGDTGGT